MDRPLLSPPPKLSRAIFLDFLQIKLFLLTLGDHVLAEENGRTRQSPRAKHRGRTKEAMASLRQMRLCDMRYDEKAQVEYFFLLEADNSDESKVF